MSCTKIGVCIPLSLFFQLSCSELSILTQETYKLINLIPSKVEAKTTRRGHGRYRWSYFGCSRNAKKKEKKKDKNEMKTN